MMTVALALAQNKGRHVSNETKPTQCLCEKSEMSKLSHRNRGEDITTSAEKTTG